jgi:hypothetical protein
MKGCVENLAQRRKKARVDDENPASGAQDATDLGESVPRSEKVMENPRQSDGVEGLVIPRQAILCIRRPQIHQGPGFRQPFRCDLQNPRCQVDPEELRGSGLGKPFEEASGGTPNVQNPKRADLRAQFLNNGSIHKRDRLHPDARVVTRWHLEIVTAIAACLVSIGLSKCRQFEHVCSLSLALPTVCVSGVGTGAENAWKQDAKRLEAGVWPILARQVPMG